MSIRGTAHRPNEDHGDHFGGQNGPRIAFLTIFQKKNFLGEIPLNPEVGKFGDLGKPIVEHKPDHEINKTEIYSPLCVLWI